VRNLSIRLVAAFAFFIGMAITVVPYLAACSSTYDTSSVTNTACSAAGCAGNRVNVSCKWSASWTINNTDPTSDAAIGTQIKVQRQLATGGNITTDYTSGWSNHFNVSCNQTYALNNQNFDTHTDGYDCMAQCHQPMAPGTHFQYRVELIAGWNSWNGTSWANTNAVDGAFVDSGC
jgi:hypothetical protein